MSNDKYTKALAELKVILDYSEDRIIEKIPKNFVTFVEKNYDRNYSCKIKPDVSICNQNILDETRYLIALVYRSYLCNQDERKEYDKILQENETNYQKAIKEKYNTDIFNVKKRKINEGTNLPIVIKKESIFKRIINKIKIFINGG